MMKGISVNGSSMTQHHSNVKQANYSIVNWALNSEV